jgi:hypothetical protein
MKMFQVYCKKQEILFNIIVVVNNALGHPQNVSDHSENINIPPPPSTVTIPLLQLMDQGVIENFEVHYLNGNFFRLIRQCDADDKLRIK